MLLVLNTQLSITADTADNDTLESSEVQVWLDMSNQQIGLMLNRDIQFSYRDFAQVTNATVVQHLSDRLSILLMTIILCFSYGPYNLNFWKERDRVKSLLKLDKE